MFRIVERKFSANIIEMGTEIGKDKKGNPSYSWTVYLVPVIQNSGDTFIERKNNIDNVTKILCELNNQLLVK